MVGQPMGRTVQLSVLAAVGFVPPLLALVRLGDPRVKDSIYLSLAVSLVAFFATRWLLPKVARKTAARGICGKDLNKRGTPAGEVRPGSVAPFNSRICSMLCYDVSWVFVHRSSAGCMCYSDSYVITIVVAPRL